MNKVIEHSFERIAAEAIRQAESVDCSLTTFVIGLRDIELAIEERRNHAERELRNELLPQEKRNAN